MEPLASSSYREGVNLRKILPTNFLPVFLYRNEPEREEAGYEQALSEVIEH